MSYNSILLIPASNVASPITTPVIPVGSPMVFQLPVEAAPAAPSSLYLVQTSPHESSYRPSSTQCLPPPSSALCQLSSAQPKAPPHPSTSLCVPQPQLIPVPAVMYVSPLSEAYIPVPSREVASAYIVEDSVESPSRCPVCSLNSSNNRAKGGLRRYLRRLLGG